MMRTHRGIVCEIKTAYTVFLTEEGEFIRGYSIGDAPVIGQEMEFRTIKDSPVRKKTLIAAPLFVAAMILVFFFASIYPETEKALAYVQIETKNAVEFSVDKNGTVVAYHQFGDNQSVVPEKLFSEWIGLPIRTVLGEAVDELTKERKTDELLVTLVYKDNGENPKVKDIMTKAVKEARSSQKELTWQVVESTEQERTRAKERNTTIQMFKKQQDVPSSQHDSGEGNKKQDAGKEHGSGSDHPSQIEKVPSIVQPSSKPEDKQSVHPAPRNKDKEELPSRKAIFTKPIEKGLKMPKKEEAINKAKNAAKESHSKNQPSDGQHKNNPASQNHPDKGDIGKP